MFGRAAGAGPRAETVPPQQPLGTPHSPTAAPYRLETRQHKEWVDEEEEEEEEEGKAAAAEEEMEPKQRMPALVFLLQLLCTWLVVAEADTSADVSSSVSLW